MKRFAIIALLYFTIIPASAQAKEVLMANKPKSQAYARYLQKNGCLDSNGNRTYQGACKFLEDESRYLRYYEHLKQVGCLDSNGDRLNNLFCKNTEPSS